MKQLSIFSNITDCSQKSNFELYVDGASRNNPGLSGAGIYITKNKEDFLKTGCYLGIKTNNQAEYLALLLGLLFISKYIKTEDQLEIISDSELLVRQISGQYKISNPELKKLYIHIKEILDNLNYKIRHVLRNNNQTADKLANQAIDQKIDIPLDLKEKLKFTI